MKLVKSVIFVPVYGTPSSEEPKDGEVVSRGSSDDPRLERESVYDCAASAMNQLRGGGSTKKKKVLSDTEGNYDAAI